jgi:hypothetical protein
MDEPKAIITIGFNVKGNEYTRPAYPDEPCPYCQGAFKDHTHEQIRECAQKEYARRKKTEKL